MPIYISYAVEDIDIMRHIRKFLEERGFTAYADEAPIEAPLDAKVPIDKGLEEADAMIVILSPDAKTSRRVNREIDYAHNVAVYAVLARGDRNIALPPELSIASLPLIDISHANKYPSGMQQLLYQLHIREQLMLIADRIPTTYLVAVSSADGLKTASYARRHVKSLRSFGREDRVSAISAAMASVGERIVSELNGTVYRYGVFKGNDGTVFNILLGDDALLSLGVREVKSIDATLIILQQWWGELLRLLDIPAPEL